MADLKTTSPTFNALRSVEGILRKHFEIKDWQGVRILFAVAAAHYIPGEPLWFRMIGASRSGRTELFRTLSEDEDSVDMESLTPASIRGGMISGKRILDRINNKRVITKDLAPFVTTRRESRLEILGLFRSIKDGSLSSDFGTTEGHISQKVSFDWIIAVTPIIESYRSIESLLGERYIDLHWIPGDREEMAYRAAKNNPRLPEIRKQLSAQVCSLLSMAKKIAASKEIVILEASKKIIAKYADTVALCRSPVQKDSRGNIMTIPMPEIGTSLAQDFCRTALGLRLLGISNWQPYIERLAWDCIPSVRGVILQALQKEKQTVRELHESTGLATSTIYYHMKDLMLLKVVKNAIVVWDSNDRPKFDWTDEEDGNDTIKKELAVTLPPVPKKVR